MPVAAHPQAACARALRNCWGPHSETGRLAVYIPSHLIAVNECVHGTGPEQGNPLITTRMCVYTYIIVQETLQLPALTGNSFGSCASAHLRASCRGVRTQQRQHVLMACGFSTCMLRASSGNRIAKRRSLRSAAERKHNHAAGEAVQRSKYVRDKK